MKTTGSLVESKKKCRCEEARRVGCWMWPLGERLIYSTKAIIIAARREVDANRLKRGPLFILFCFFFFFFFFFSLRFWLSSFHSLFQVFLSFNLVSSFLPFRDHIHIVLFFKWLNPTGKKKWNKTKLFPFLGSLWNSLSNITSRGWNLRPRYVHLDELATWDPEYWVSGLLTFSFSDSGLYSQCWVLTRPNRFIR